MARQLRVDIALRGKKAPQTGSTPAHLQKAGVVGHQALLGIDHLFLLIDLLGQLRHQVLDLVGQVVGQAQDHFRGGFRPFACDQIRDQRLCRPHRSQAQGNHPVRIGKDAQRDHILRLSPRIEVDPAQEQQQLMLRQRQHPRPGVLFEQQVAGKLAQPAVAAQPVLGLWVTAIPVHPEAFLLGQLQILQLVTINGPRPAQPIEDKGMDQAAVFTRHCGI